MSWTACSDTAAYRTLIGSCNMLYGKDIENGMVTFHFMRTIKKQ